LKQTGSTLHKKSAYFKKQASLKNVVNINSVKLSKHTFKKKLKKLLLDLKIAEE